MKEWQKKIVEEIQKYKHSDFEIMAILPGEKMPKGTCYCKDPESIGLSIKHKTSGICTGRCFGESQFSQLSILPQIPVIIQDIFEYELAVFYLRLLEKQGIKGIDCLQTIRKGKTIQKIPSWKISQVPECDKSQSKEYSI